VNLRTVARVVGRTAANVWRVLVVGVRRRLGRVHGTSPVLDALRRRYVFGALTRRQFDEAVKRSGRRFKRGASSRRV
jgi:hypothetical protein